MTGTMATTVAMCVGLVACSSETEGTGSAGCADISGSYNVTSVRVLGTCDPALDPTGPTTVTMTRSADGWTAVLPGIEGGCPGTLDAQSCRFISTCEFRDAQGRRIGTMSLDYVFASADVSGSAANALLPPAVTTACTVTYRETGEKL